MIHEIIAYLKNDAEERKCRPLERGTDVAGHHYGDRYEFHTNSEWSLGLIKTGLEKENIPYKETPACELTKEKFAQIITDYSVKLPVRGYLYIKKAEVKEDGILITSFADEQALLPNEILSELIENQKVVKDGKPIYEVKFKALYSLSAEEEDMAFRLNADAGGCELMLSETKTLYLSWSWDARHHRCDETGYLFTDWAEVNIEEAYVGEHIEGDLPYYEQDFWADLSYEDVETLEDYFKSQL